MIKRRYLGQPAWAWAVCFVVMTAVGVQTSWRALGNVWSWPVLVMWAAFGSSVWLEARRYRKKLAAAPPGSTQGDAL